MIKTVGNSVDQQRRRLIALAAASVMAPIWSVGRTAHAAGGPIKAVAFDAFPIFDPRAVFATVRQLFPERGDALREAWFARLFAYTWLRTAARQYEGFGSVIGQAFDAVTRALGITATARDRDELVQAFSRLPVWPDVVGQLGLLRDAGLRPVFLSNLSEEMLRANMKRNGIEDFFEAALSTDRVRAFKPAPEAYQLGDARTPQRGNRLRRVCRLGRDWRGLVRLSERVDQPAGPTGRSPRHHARRRGKRPLGFVRFH